MKSHAVFSVLLSLKTCFDFLCCFRMEASKKKQDASDIVQDNNKTLRDFDVLVSTENRVYSRFTKYNISHYSPFKFAKK